MAADGIQVTGSVGYPLPIAHGIQGAGALVRLELNLKYSIQGVSLIIILVQIN
jgi:hypothetical protein